jgi:ABC-type lipoprotein export system ATPase subunit
MLFVRNLTKVFFQDKKKIVALNKISLSLNLGEMVMIVGPSGSGKTTLLFTIGGLLQPDQGEIILAGKNLYGLSRTELAFFRAQKIGFVFQEFHLIPYLNVLDNVLIGTYYTPQAGRREKAIELLTHFKLEERLTHLPARLSTGEKQRVALARAVIHHPQIILADEPTGNLDQKNAILVLEYLAEFARAGGMVLLVTHNPEITKYAHRLLQLEAGHLS